MQGTYFSTTFAVPLCLEFINTVNISFYRCGYNIRICSEAIINLIIIFHLHMNLTYIITSLANSLNSEFFQCHVTIYDLFRALMAASTGPLPLAQASNFSPEIFSPRLATERTPTPLVTCKYSNLIR